MAIDTSVFTVDIPAGSVSAGDVFEMSCSDGPAVVRSGRGAALLKRFTSFKVGAAGVGFKMFFINSDWIDPVINETGGINGTCFDRRTGMYQSGNNCPLTQNSSWHVYAVATSSGTATAGTLFGLIDIDYPSVSSIIDPDALPGFPTSIEVDMGTITSIAAGSYTGSGWAGGSVDIFKAGYEYALQKISIENAASVLALVSISNAAGMGGLCRIVPSSSDATAIRSIVEYASKLTKGPMDVKIKLVNTSAASDTATVLFDFVKRRV